MSTTLDKLSILVEAGRATTKKRKSTPLTDQDKKKLETLKTKLSALPVEKLNGLIRILDEESTLIFDETEKTLKSKVASTKVSLIINAVKTSEDMQSLETDLKDPRIKKFMSAKSSSIDAIGFGNAVEEQMAKAKSLKLTPEMRLAVSALVKSVDDTGNDLMQSLHDFGDRSDRTYASMQIVLLFNLLGEDKAITLMKQYGLTVK